MSSSSQCPYCGANFTPRSSRQLTCGASECQAAHTRSRYYKQRREATLQAISDIISRVGESSEIGDKSAMSTADLLAETKEHQQRSADAIAKMKVVIKEMKRRGLDVAEQELMLQEIVRDYSTVFGTEDDPVSN